MIFFLSYLFVYKMLFTLLPDILLLFGLCMQKLCFKSGFFYLSVQATINQLRAELAKGPQEVAVYVQELQKLQSSVKELEQKNQVRMLLFPMLVSSR